ncbi:MAG: hypothetical protein MJ033_02715 [Victivallaceae bacterium]|nr:hypothetical protein [Victivallaceae bacterium]
MAKSYTIAGKNFALTAKSTGKYIYSLAVDGVERLAVGRVCCGKFTELGALDKKFRVHREEANFLCGIDTVCVLPFGCEYEVKRTLECGDGALDFSTDVAALHFGRVGDLALEELFFPGDGSQVSLLLLGENGPEKFSAAEQGEIYHGKKLPLLLRVDFSDGVSVEYQTGFDVWRHDAASAMTGVSAEFSLVRDEKGLHLFRQVLRYDEGVESEKRPWRFNTLVAWKSASDQSFAPRSQAETIPGCPLSGAWRRELRRRIRRTQGDFLLGGVSTALCDDPSHLDRGGRGALLHSPMQEYLASYRWANRELRKAGGVFTLDAEKDHSLLGEVLSRPPRELLPETEEIR